MTGSVIIKVLEKLIGETRPAGDTAIDNERLKNLETLLYVTDWCLNKIANSALLRNRSENSIRLNGRTACRYLIDTEKWIHRFEFEE